MIKKLMWIKAPGFNPYENLALEEYLTMKVSQEQCILYLWQNRRTVVIGKNQNSWKECNTSALERDGGYLARRLSGGGAVYHDLGNLNFTFCLTATDYDVDKQLQVILNAVKASGIDAKKTGRNDLTVADKKFSGNAFYRIGEQCYHHGTIMVDVNTDDLSKYLNVDKSKLSSKGVSSARARVSSLTSFNPSLTIDEIVKNLICAFSNVYNLPVQEISARDFPQNELITLRERYESWDWRYGRRIPFNLQLQRRFSWGDICFHFQVSAGLILDVGIYSDAMDQDVIELFADSLKNTVFSESAIAEAIDDAILSTNQSNVKIIVQMKNDIISLIRDSI